MTGSGSKEAPVNHVLPAWDMACAFQAAFAIVSAVERRRRTGQGAELRLALADAAFTMLSHLGLTAEAELLEQDREPLGNHIYGAFGRDFGTKDAQRVMVAGISAGQWTALVKACGIEAAIAELERITGSDLAQEAQRFEARDAIAALLEPWFAQRTLAEVRQVLDANRVCWGLYRCDARAAARRPARRRGESGLGAHRHRGHRLAPRGGNAGPRTRGGPRHDPARAPARAAHRRGPARGAADSIRQRSAGCTMPASSPGRNAIRRGSGRRAALG